MPADDSSTRPRPGEAPRGPEGAVREDGLGRRYRAGSRRPGLKETSGTYEDTLFHVFRLQSARGRGQPLPTETPAPTGPRGCWDTITPRPRSSRGAAGAQRIPARPMSPGPTGVAVTPADRGGSSAPPRRPVSVPDATEGPAGPRF